jgi:hypothetical protein
VKTWEIDAVTPTGATLRLNKLPMRIADWLKMAQQVSVREQLDGLSELRDKHLILETDRFCITQIMQLARKLGDKLPDLN